LVPPKNSVALQSLEGIHEVEDGVWLGTTRQKFRAVDVALWMWRHFARLDRACSHTELSRHKALLFAGYCQATSLSTVVCSSFD
jgi:hypothetical protein